MFKTYWQKGFDYFKQGATIKAMYDKFNVEQGSLASFELSAGFKAASRNRTDT